MKCLRHTHLFLQVLYSTLRIGLHDSFLASFCIFPASEEKQRKSNMSRLNYSFIIRWEDVRRKAVVHLLLRSCFSLFQAIWSCYLLLCQSDQCTALHCVHNVTQCEHNQDIVRHRNPLEGSNLVSFPTGVLCVCCVSRSSLHWMTVHYQS